MVVATSEACASGSRAVASCVRSEAARASGSRAVVSSVMHDARSPHAQGVACASWLWPHARLHEHVRRSHETRPHVRSLHERAEKSQ